MKFTTAAAILLTCVAVSACTSNVATDAALMKDGKMMDGDHAMKGDKMMKDAKMMDGKHAMKGDKMMKDAKMMDGKHAMKGDKMMKDTMMKGDSCHHHAANSMTNSSDHCHATNSAEHSHKYGG